MWVVLEFLLRILLACGVFATCLTVMWFIAWMLILRHVKLFQEIICGSGKTPHPSPLKSPQTSEGGVGSAESSEDIFLGSPVVHKPFSGKQTQPEYPSHRSPSPLSLPPPMEEFPCPSNPSTPIHSSPQQPHPPHQDPLLQRSLLSNNSHPSMLLLPNIASLSHHPLLSSPHHPLLSSPHPPLTSPHPPLPFSKSSPSRHRRPTLSPGIHPRVQRPINSKKPTTTPCQINHFVDHWF